VAILPGILTVLLTLGIKEPVRDELPAVKSFSWSLAGMSSPFKRYLIVAGIFTLGNSSDMFLLLRAKDVGVPQSEIPLLWAGVSLVTTLFGAPLSSLSDHFSRKHFILIAWAAFTFFYIAMGIPNISIIQICTLFIIYGLFKAATEGVEKL
jgi:MFS family permease